jgi:hypothetical protein
MTKPRNRNKTKPHHRNNTAPTTTTTKLRKMPQEEEQPQPTPNNSHDSRTAPANRNTTSTVSSATTAASKTGKTLKAYEQELKLRSPATNEDHLNQQEEHQAQQRNLQKTDHISFEDYYDDTDEDLIHLLTYDSDDYDSTYDPFYDSDDESSYDPFYTCNDESYNTNTNPAPELSDMPPEYIPFSNYANRCLATCSTLEHHQIMDSLLARIFQAYVYGELQGHNIDWDNAPLLTPDPTGDFSPTASCYTYLSRPDPVTRDPPGTILPSHDNLSYIDTDLLPQDLLLPQDPTGFSFPATWTYPPLPAPASFVQQTNSPPPLPTLRLLPVNDITKIDNTWTAKAIAAVAHTLLWNTASPVGRWAYVPPRKKLRSKKMKMDAQAAAAA